MKKDIIRDYATDAFCFYAKSGFPKSDIKELKIPEILDIQAAYKVILTFERDKKGDIIKAIKGVYYYPICRNDISMRVHEMSLKIPASEANVYRWLKKARDLFAKFRELRKVDSSGE